MIIYWFNWEKFGIKINNCFVVNFNLKIELSYFSPHWGSILFFSVLIWRSLSQSPVLRISFNFYVSLLLSNFLSCNLPFTSYFFLFPFQSCSLCSSRSLPISTSLSICSSFSSSISHSYFPICFSFSLFLYLTFFELISNAFLFDIFFLFYIR